MNKVLGNPALETWPHFSEKVLDELEALETEADFFLLKPTAEQ